jgi:hypothetical protein
MTSPSPRSSRGEGWSEGLLQRILRKTRARRVPLTRIASQSDLSPQAGRGELATTSCAAGGCAVEKVLLAPFRPGAAHIVIFRPVFPERPVPGRTHERHHGAESAANHCDENGCDVRNPRHVTLHAKNRMRIWRARWSASPSRTVCRPRLELPAEANAAQFQLALHAAQF